MRNSILAWALVILAFTSNGTAGSTDALVGTWKLVSATDSTDNGEVKDAYGLHPSGFLTYTADGRMMAIITSDGRKPLSTPDWIAAPVGERADAFATLVAYAGSYTIAGNKIVHHVEAASAQNFVGAALVRFIVKYDATHVTLRTPPFMKGGVLVAHEELVWERVKPELGSQ